MQIGIFGNTKSSLYDLMNGLSRELGFSLATVEGIDDCAMVELDGLVVLDNLQATEEVAHMLKRFKNILMLNPEQATTTLTPELAIICEEAEVELMIAGPNFHHEVFRFIERHTHSPYYVRVVKEQNSLESINFETIYKLFYWNAFFSEGEIRKFKVSTMPAVTERGIVIYGRTESSINIPVDIWFTNLGFETKDYIKIFAQTEVLELDLHHHLLYFKDKEGEVKESYAHLTTNNNETYIRSFIGQLQDGSKKSLNLSLPKFLKLVEYYNSMLQRIRL